MARPLRSRALATLAAAMAASSAPATRRPRSQVRVEEVDQALLEGDAGGGAGGAGGGRGGGRRRRAAAPGVAAKPPPEIPDVGGLGQAGLAEPLHTFHLILHLDVAHVVLERRLEGEPAPRAAAVVQLEH